MKQAGGLVRTTLVLEHDAEFRPTRDPLRGIPSIYHSGLVQGSLQLACLTESARLGVIHSRGRTTTQGLPEFLDELDSKLVDMACFTPVSKPQATAAMTTRPSVTRYAVDRQRYGEARDRRVQGMLAAMHINETYCVEVKSVESLSDLAVWVLGRASERTLWLHRSVAEAVRELVRAGKGDVHPDGYFVPRADIAAKAQVVARLRGLWVERTASRDATFEYAI